MPIPNGANRSASAGPMRLYQRSAVGKRRTEMPDTDQALKSNDTINTSATAGVRPVVNAEGLSRGRTVGRIQRLRQLGALTLVSWLVWLVGCSMTNHESPKSDAAGTPIPTHGPFVLDPAKFEGLRAQVNGLKLGDSRVAAAGSVGQPDREDLFGPKKGTDWTCRNVVYYVAIVDQLPGNTNDKQVTLVFDRKEDRLVAIMSNVEGIPSRGELRSCRPGHD